MAAIIGSPTRYIQGKGEMKNLCSYADKFGKNLFILTSASGRKRVEPAINEGNKDSNLVYDVFNGRMLYDGDQPNYKDRGRSRK